VAAVVAMVVSVAEAVVGVGVVVGYCCVVLSCVAGLEERSSSRGSRRIYINLPSNTERYNLGPRRR
jgi:hypothetical protein